MEYPEHKLIDKDDDGIFYCVECGHSEDVCVVYGCGDRFRGKVLLDVKCARPQMRLVVTTEVVYQVRGDFCTFYGLEPDVVLGLQTEHSTEEED